MRALAPLRLGLAGGGTDLSPFCDDHGGYVLNCTINLFARVTITPATDGVLRFHSTDLGQFDECLPQPSLPRDGLALHRAVYSRVVRDLLGGEAPALTVVSSVDAPPGSGLGSSSALVVALVRALAQFLDVPLPPHQVARMAFEIERIDLGMAGGRQDHYAAAFGGFNIMEFRPADEVVVTPVPLPEDHLREFEGCLLVCHTGRSRLSSTIIEQQIDGLRQPGGVSVDAMLQIKQCAVEMRAALQAGDMERAARALGHSWEAKKRTAAAVSSGVIDDIYALALRHGAWAGKISGAGGGGHMMFMVPPERRCTVAQRLAEHGLSVVPVQLAPQGSLAWAAPSPRSLVTTP